MNEERSAERDAGAYVCAMSDADLADLLDDDLRRATGRCVSPRVLRAAQVEAEVRDAEDGPPASITVPLGYERDPGTGMNRGRAHYEVPIEYDPDLATLGERRVNPYGPCPIVLREWNEQVLLHELLHVLLDGSVPTSEHDPHGHRTISRAEVALWEAGWRWRR